MDPRLLEAAARGDYGRFVQVVEEDPGRLSAQGNTLLHFSARLGNEQLVSWVGDRFPGLLARANSAGDTALHLAARAGHVPVVMSLLAIACRDAHLADALLMARNLMGDTALHEALRNCHELVAFRLMAARSDLASLVNISCESPLYLAAERGYPEIVKILLESELSAWEWEGPGGKTALHAAVCRSYHIAKMLLDKGPEFGRKQDHCESTPLHYAASNGDPQMVQLLLKYDTSVAYIFDAAGLSPIHVAATMGHVGVIQELIKTCPESGQLTDSKGKNLLHFAIEKKRLEVVKYVLKTPLLKEIINERDHYGNTALHLATINCSTQVVHMLLANKRVNTNIMNHKGFTPLDIASSSAKSYVGLRMYKIRQALVSAGSRRSPQRLDHLVDNRQRNQEEEMVRCRAIANNLIIVAVLIATVTFTAAFTLPGGYRNDVGPDQGTAVLTRKAAFKVFLISDAVAMVCSMAVVCLLIHTGSLDHDIRLHSISRSVKLMQVALGGMVVAFAAGVYVVTAGGCTWLAILVCVVVSSVPLWVLSLTPTFNPLKAVKSHMERRGWNREERRIHVPKVLKFMGFERTIDFVTPAITEEPSESASRQEFDPVYDIHRILAFVCQASSVI